MNAMDAAGTNGNGDARPAAPPVPPSAPPATVPRPSSPPPPMPRRPPIPPFVAWLRTPRRADALGIWGFGHVPRPPLEPDRVPGRRLLGGALLWLLAALLIWSLYWHGYLPFLVWPLLWLTPAAWRSGAAGDHTAFALANAVYNLVLAALFVLLFGRGGHWLEVVRRYAVPLLHAPAPPPPGAASAEEPQDDPVEWPSLRVAGQAPLADRLAEEARAGRMNDVDYLRLRRAWQSVEAEPERLEPFAAAVLRHGAAACVHPSGARDLPVRTARHDLLACQVRIGTAVDTDRNAHAYRGAGLALDPPLLGTSLLAVGPPGSGKTRHVARPVIEALCLQALAGTAAVVAVGPAGADLGSTDAFDVVIALGDPRSAHDLDLYGGATDADEAAAILAEALLDGTAGIDPAAGDPRRAATALAQLLGPYRAAHGRFPSVTELRELLDGSPTAFAALRDALDEAGEHAELRELAARQRQSERGGEIGALLADRIALLDRPAFAGFFDVSGRTRPFTLRTIEHPLRVRVALPERGHAEASRIVARLVLAQFTAAVTARRDRSLFACLVLDDAAHAVTPEAVRGLQRLRSANAGAVLTLRALEDVPEALRSALLGVTGCRIALSGVTTWDGKRFAEAWGTTWVEESDVTRAPDLSGGLPRRALRGLRRLFTGEAATTESVTVRRVERQRWSASDLAHAVPPGHAVASFASVSGEQGPPLLLDLRS